MTIEATKIIKLSERIIRLNQLLAWELAALPAHLRGSFTVVQLQMYDGRNTQLFLNTQDLEDLVSASIIKELNALESEGVDTKQMLESFKATASKITEAQQTKTPLDKPEGA